MVEIPVIPENAPFDLEQRLWLNGFLAGYFSRRALPSEGALTAAPSPVRCPVRILFGSQTGTAQGLAKRMGKEAAARGCRPEVTDAADFGKVDWAAERFLLLVTSTYGDGDMPDNAQPFWDWLQTDAAAVMGKLQFAVLALGDRNYEAFCNAGKRFDARLEELGAKRLLPRAECDVDYESTAKAWMDSALEAVTGAQTAVTVPGASEALADTNTAKPALRAGQYSKTNPFGARLLRNVRLTRAGSGKEVRHYELSLQDSGLSYEPGDALGVVPVNCPELVSDVLAALRASGDELVTVAATEMSLCESLTRHLDICKPSPELLKAIAQRAPTSELPPLLLPGRGEHLKQWLWGRGIIDLLHFLPEPLPPAEVATLLKKLTPRLYSISSSPRAHPEEVHLTVNVVRYESHGRARKGVASTFLADRIGDADYVKVFVQPSHGFKLPPSGDTPIIMVGPGTGIAPFRAFLEERQAVAAKGRNWLFFGDQKRDTDFLYEEQLYAWVQAGHLTRLDLAFSRDQVDKVYVQHRMLAQAVELWAWLQDGAHFYVCGDASRMAKDVDSALHQVAQTAGGLGIEEAKAWVAKLKSDKRYQRDVY
jgi:sulfite reductase (NADPH) flavoprotein alpha-component